MMHDGILDSGMAMETATVETPTANHSGTPLATPMMTPTVTPMAIPKATPNETCMETLNDGFHIGWRICEIGSHFFYDCAFR